MNRWQRYEDEKMRLQSLLKKRKISVHQYERLIRKLAKRLKI